MVVEVRMDVVVLVVVSRGGGSSTNWLLQHFERNPSNSILAFYTC